jgi:glycosyltransferase involved in cell wall biosynthesis
LDLLRLKPQIVISTEFYIWTILAVLLKPIGGWKVVVLWTGSSPGVDLVDDHLRSSVRRWVAKHADAFITNSLTGKHYLHNHLRVSNDRAFQIVYKPGDAKALSKKPTTDPLMEETQRPRFLYVGQLIPRKGLHYLLEAWSKLQKLSSTHGSLLIIGDGPQRDELIQQASTLDLEDVHFIGRVEYGSLGSWYQACDVFVFPTLEDIWANVVCEAMVFGKPVLCSKYAGAAELVHHGNNGFIFEPDDTDHLARLMLELVNTPELIEKFGQKSMEIMEPNTLTNAVEAFGDVMDLVLNSEKTKRGKRDVIGNVSKKRV